MEKLQKAMEAAFNKNEAAKKENEDLKKSLEDNKTTLGKLKKKTQSAQVKEQVTKTIALGKKIAEQVTDSKKRFEKTAADLKTAETELKDVAKKAAEKKKKAEAEKQQNSVNLTAWKHGIESLAGYESMLRQAQHKSAAADKQYDSVKAGQKRADKDKKKKLNLALKQQEPICIFAANAVKELETKVKKSKKALVEVQKEIEKVTGKDLGKIEDNIVRGRFKFSNMSIEDFGNVGWKFTKEDGMVLAKNGSRNIKGSEKNVLDSLQSLSV